MMLVVILVTRCGNVPGRRGLKSRRCGHQGILRPALRKERPPRPHGPFRHLGSRCNPIWIVGASSGSPWGLRLHMADHWEWLRAQFERPAKRFSKAPAGSTKARVALHTGPRPAVAAAAPPPLPPPVPVACATVPSPSLPAQSPAAAQEDAPDQDPAQHYRPAHR